MAVYMNHNGIPTNGYRAAVGTPQNANPSGGLVPHVLPLQSDPMVAYGAVLDGRYKDGGHTNWETESAPPPSGS